MDLTTSSLVEAFKELDMDLVLQESIGDKTIYSANPTHSVIFYKDNPNLLTTFSTLSWYLDSPEKVAEYSSSYLKSAKVSAQLLSEEIPEEDLPMFLMTIAEQTKVALKKGRVSGSFDDLKYSIVSLNGTNVLDIYK